MRVMTGHARACPSDGCPTLPPEVAPPEAQPTTAAAHKTHSLLIALFSSRECSHHRYRLSARHAEFPSGLDLGAAGGAVQDLQVLSAMRAKVHRAATGELDAAKSAFHGICARN